MQASQRAEGAPSQEWPLSMGPVCVRSGWQAGKSKAPLAPAEVGSGKPLRSVWGGPVSGGRPLGSWPV